MKGRLIMRMPRQLFPLVLVFVLCCSSLFGLAPNDNAAGAAGCFACSGFLGFLIALFVLNIALLVWVARDAKARGMDSAILWMLLVMFTGIIGLIIYPFARPQGNMVQCPNCHNRRLQASVKCPHCAIGA